jgi:hypothetical protein
VDEEALQYKLEVSNETPIYSKPMRLSPKEEAWLGGYLKELLAKGVITPILPHENPINGDPRPPGTRRIKRTAVPDGAKYHPGKQAYCRVPIPTERDQEVPSTIGEA